MPYEVIEAEAKLPGYDVIEPDQAQASQIKQDYIAKGGNPRDVLSPERQKIFDDEVRNQLAVGATPEQAALSASKKLDLEQPITRVDGTIAGGYKPTEQAIQDGVIEEKALPAVKLAQSRGIKTISSGTDKATGGGFAIGQDQSGNTVRVEVDSSGKELLGYDVIEEPSMLGAIGRTILSQAIPTTTGAVAAETAAALPIPGGLPARLIAGGVAGYGGYVAGQKGQEAAGKALLGPERMARISEVLQRDVEKYPIATTVAALGTPSIGGAIGIVKGIPAIGKKISQMAAPSVAEEVAPSISGIAAKEETKISGTITGEAMPVGAVGEEVKLPEVGKGQFIRQTARRIIEDKSVSKQVREDIAKADIIGQKFASKQQVEDLSLKTFDELDQLTKIGSPAERVAATIAQYNKASELGDLANQAKIKENLKAISTDPAQALATWKQLKTTTPDGYLLGLNQVAEKAGRKINAVLSEQAKKAFQKMSEARNNFKINADKARLTSGDADIALAIKSEKEYVDALRNLNLFESRLIPKKILGETLPTIIQGNLLSPLSLVTNVWANVVNAPLRMAARQSAFISQEVGRAFQSMIGKKLGEREIAPTFGRQGLERTREVLMAGLRGAAEGYAGLKSGITPEGLLAGEKIKGLAPLRAFKQFWNGEGLADPIQSGLRGVGAKAMDRVRLATESVLGIPPETMLRFLQAGDTPFRRMAEARLLAEQAQLRGLTGQALKTAVRFPTIKELSKIENEALQSVYQQDTPLTRAAINASQLFGLGGGPGRLLGKTIIPYAKTPVNVISELVQYALPEVTIPMAIYNATKGDYRKANMLFGKGVVGATIQAVATYLSKNDLIGGKPSTSEKVRDIQYQTLPPRTINISGLNRLAKGESPELEPGDRVISLDKLGIVGGILSTVDAALKATQRGSDDASLDIASLFPETLSFAFNQSFLKGTNSLLSAMMDGNGGTLDKWISDYYGVISSVPFPNTLTALSRSMRETMPEKFQIKDVGGEGLVERQFNTFSEVLKRRLPGMDEDMARRIDIWGREIPQTPEGADPIAYNFLDVTKGREISYDPVTLGIYKIFKETDDGDVVPPKPQRNFTINNIKYRLDPDLYETYSRMRGVANRKAAESLFSEKSFQRMKNEDKVVVLRSAYARVGDDTRKEFLSKYENRIKLGEIQ